MDVNQHNVCTCHDTNGFKLSLVTRDGRKSSLGMRAYKETVPQNSHGIICHLGSPPQRSRYKITLLKLHLETQDQGAARSRWQDTPSRTVARLM